MSIYLFHLALLEVLFGDFRKSVTLQNKSD